MKDDPSNLSMLELFRVEAENQTALLTSGLLELERVMGDECRVTSDGKASLPSHATRHTSLLESLMRAAHSLKGAARIVNLPSAVRVAHAMEDCFVAAQQGKLELRQPHIDVLLRGVDLLANLSKRSEKNLAPWNSTLGGCGSPRGIEGPETVPSRESIIPRGESGPGYSTGRAAWEEDHATKIEEFLGALQRSVTGDECRVTSDGKASLASPDTRHLSRREGDELRVTRTADPLHVPRHSSHDPDRVLRLTAENLNRLLGLAGESLVESRWLRPFSESMQRLKRMQSDLERTLEGLRRSLESDKWQVTSDKSEKGGIMSPVTGHVSRSVNELSQQAAETRPPSAVVRERLDELGRELRRTGQFLGDRLQELELFDRRSAHLSNRLYLEVLRTRMRPFGDGTRRFPRMVRDLARSLGKQAKLEIIGETTQVDRDILDRLESPLAHLLRNAVDHGCETPEERERAGKPPEATIRLEARHSAGLLMVVVSDDGAGLDSERLRQAIAHKKLTTPALAPWNSRVMTWAEYAGYSTGRVARMNEAELLQFLFLPGFTMRDTVTELSGRGVGLDIVQNMVKSVRGSVRVFRNETANRRTGETAASPSRRLADSPAHPQRPNSGLTFVLQLPLTMSVLRTLLVEVGGSPRGIGLDAATCDRLGIPRGEPYAFPLAQIAQTLRLPREKLELLEGRQHFKLGEQQVGLLALWNVLGYDAPDPPALDSTGRAAHQVFGCEEVTSDKWQVTGSAATGPLSCHVSPVTCHVSPDLPIIVLGEPSRAGGRYGLLVDRFLGERELVVQPLDPRLGKVKDISAAALMEDGSPVLIVDVDDLMRSIEELIREGTIPDSGYSMLDRSPQGRAPPASSIQPVLRSSPSAVALPRLATAEGGHPASSIPRRKRILAVDDSLTVRELERKLLTDRGYLADTAVDGMDGWNALRTGVYDLIIMDVDMPRLDGIELATLIRRPSSVAVDEVYARHPELLRRVDDPCLKSLPIMMVSYKDCEEDRLRGLEAGADYYLTKGSFQDETLLQAVLDLIGAPEA